MHTFDYINSNLPILLTAILAASSKFFRPQYQRNLLEYAHVLLNRLLNSGVCNIDIIQALLVLVCFKAPVDRSAWVKIGTAIRLGYQHGWYQRKSRVLPADPYEARRVLVSFFVEIETQQYSPRWQDPERTWYCE